MTDITSLSVDHSPSKSFSSSSFVRDSLQVLAYNRISRTENPLSGYDKDRFTHASQLKYFVPSIVQFIFHSFPSSAGPSTSHFLATLDLYRGEELEVTDCTSLKIWTFSAASEGGGGAQRKYLLLTQVDRPHGSHRITSMVFFLSQPTRPSLATSSDDGMVKIWAR
jgi:hypothetical protein